MKTLLFRARRNIPRSLRHLIYRAGMFFGDECASASAQFGGSEFPSLTATLRYLREWGYRPRTITDVGAFRGDWTRLAREIFPKPRC